MGKFDYKEMLKRARSVLPSTVFEHSRFTIPKVDSFTEGNRTFVRNFKEISETLNRPPKHILKFLLRELATAGTLGDMQAVFQGRFSRNTFDELIERYTKLYVICPECQKPDTGIKKEDRYLFLVCKACGARASLKPL